MVQHKSHNWPNGFGGTTYRTLCGRMNAASADGMNVADTNGGVTCKFCLRIMAAAEIVGRPYPDTLPKADRP